MYNIFVDDELVAEEVPHCDLKHKIEIIIAYCSSLPENRDSEVTYKPINNPETIA